MVASAQVLKYSFDMMRHFLNKWVGYWFFFVMRYFFATCDADTEYISILALPSQTVTSA